MAEGTDNTVPLGMLSRPDPYGRILSLVKAHLQDQLWLSEEFAREVRKLKAHLVNLLEGGMGGMQAEQTATYLDILHDMVLFYLNEHTIEEIDARILNDFLNFTDSEVRAQELYTQMRAEILANNRSAFPPFEEIK